MVRIPQESYCYNFYTITQDIYNNGPTKKYFHEIFESLLGVISFKIQSHLSSSFEFQWRGLILSSQWLVSALGTRNKSQKPEDYYSVRKNPNQLLVFDKGETLH